MYDALCGVVENDEHRLTEFARLCNDIGMLGCKREGDQECLVKRESLVVAMLNAMRVVLTGNTFFPNQCSAILKGGSHEFEFSS